MKKYIYILIALPLVIMQSGCSVDDIKPINQLTKENAIRDKASAQRILNGVYDQTREFDLGFIPLHLAAYGDAGLIQGNLSGKQGFNNNDVPVENPFLSNLYNGHYKVINSANFLIEELEAGSATDISEEEKKSMIAQAKIMRALMYFKLVRYFGEYYDMSSEYGVVVSTEFSEDKVAAPRNTVQEVYDQLEEDLNYGITNGPSNIEHFLVGKVMAQALLAKVKLYENEYTDAAQLASEVINNGEAYSLEADYSAVFQNTYNSSEVLFAPFHSDGSEGGSGMDQIKSTSYSDYLGSLADTQVNGPADGSLTGTGENYDPRFSYAYADATQGVNEQGKYPFIATASGQNNTIYHLRMAEVYLIHAEAEARKTNGDLSAALTSLNTIRDRAGVDAKQLSDEASLLEDIREEKTLELFYENGEPLFDLVRYGVLGDLNPADIKADLDQEYKYILPIPNKVLIGNDNLTQNPGY